MPLSVLRSVVLAPLRRFVGALGLLGAVVVLGAPIIAVLVVLGMVLQGSGLSQGTQELIGIVVGFGLLAVAMGAFGYYLIDW